MNEGVWKEGMGVVWRRRRRKERRVMSEERARKEAPARKMEN